MSTDQRILDLLDQQQKLLTLLTNQAAAAAAAAATPPAPLVPAVQTVTVESLARSLTEFSFDPDTDATFEAWYTRFEDVFTVDAAPLSDADKVRLLLRKLDTSSHAKYTSFILPKKPSDNNFAATLVVLKQLFGVSTSLFNRRYQCLKLVRRPTEDILTYVGTVNRECESFQLGTLTADQFKCLIFISGLQAEADDEYRLRLLQHVESNPNTTATQLGEEYSRMMNLKRDSQMVAQGGADRSVLAVHQRKQQQQKTAHRTKRSSSQRSASRSTSPLSNRPISPSKGNRNATPRWPCWLCGGKHFVKFCRFHTHQCSDCGHTGHKEGFCEYSGTAQSRSRNSRAHPPYRTNGVFCASTEAQSNRKLLTLLINDKPVPIQFDTGSDFTILTKDTWTRIGAPPLTKTHDDLRTASDEPMQLAGFCTCTLSHGGERDSGRCFVSSEVSHDILGLDWIDKLHLWTTHPSEPRVQQCRRGSTQRSRKPEVSALHSELSAEQLDSLFRAIPVTPQEAKKATKTDPLLRIVTRSLRDGWWPRNIYSRRLREFYKRRAVLSIQNGCIFMASRLVVPDDLQWQILKAYHEEDHPGIMMHDVLRCFVFWPTLKRDVRKIVYNCNICVSLSRSSKGSTPNSPRSSSPRTTAQRSSSATDDDAGSLDDDDVVSQERGVVCAPESGGNV